MNLHTWPEDRTSVEDIRIRLKLIEMRECLQDRRMQWTA